MVPVTAAVLALPGPPSGPLVSTQKLPPRQATTPWLLPAQPMTLASPNVPYTVWLPAGPFGAQLYGGAVTEAAGAALAAPAENASPPRLSTVASMSTPRDRAESEPNGRRIEGLPSPLTGRRRCTQRAFV